MCTVARESEHDVFLASSAQAEDMGESVGRGEVLQRSLQKRREAFEERGERWWRDTG